MGCMLKNLLLEQCIQFYGFPGIKLLQSYSHEFNRSFVDFSFVLDPHIPTLNNLVPRET
jgi:hypothetical protein